MEIQHFRVKLFATPDSHPRLGDAVPVFHRWIQNKTLPEMMIDVSDYEHVPSGPGIILVCHEAIYSLDKLGVVYNRRTAMNGPVEDRLEQAVKSAETAAALLEKEPEFSSKLRFDRNKWDVAVYDRMLAPNTEATWKVLEPSIRKVFDKVIGGGKYQLQHHADPRELFRVTVAP